MIRLLLPALAIVVALIATQVITTSFEGFAEALRNDAAAAAPKS